MLFSINIAKAFKKKANKSTDGRVSKLCLGKVFKEDDIYKIRVSTRYDVGKPDYMTFNFTEESFDLTDKVVVYSHITDKNGYYIEYHRDANFCKLFPGLPTQYCTVAENVVCSGYIVRRKGELLFNLVNNYLPGVNSVNDKSIFLAK